jgi:hypothetical protein
LANVDTEISFNRLEQFKLQYVAMLGVSQIKMTIAMPTVMCDHVPTLEDEAEEFVSSLAIFIIL